MFELLTEEALKNNLDVIARAGAKRMLAAALEIEIEETTNKYKDEVDEEGKRLVVRNGKSKPRTVTGSNRPMMQNTKKQ